MPMNEVGRSHFTGPGSSVGIAPHACVSSASPWLRTQGRYGHDVLAAELGGFRDFDAVPLDVLEHGDCNPAKTRTCLRI
jgi:hypothetical protein